MAAREPPGDFHGELEAFHAAAVDGVFTEHPEAPSPFCPGPNRDARSRRSV